MSSKAICRTISSGNRREQIWRKPFKKPFAGWASRGVLTSEFAKVGETNDFFARLKYFFPHFIRHSTTRPCNQYEYVITQSKCGARLGDLREIRHVYFAWRLCCGCSWLFMFFRSSTRCFLVRGCGCRVIFTSVGIFALLLRHYLFPIYIAVPQTIGLLEGAFGKAGGGIESSPWRRECFC